MDSTELHRIRLLSALSDDASAGVPVCLPTSLLVFLPLY
jgi:hypothetical protein